MKDILNYIIKILFLGCIVYTIFLFRNYLDQERFHYFNRFEGGGIIKVEKKTGKVFYLKAEGWRLKGN